MQVLPNRDPSTSLVRLKDTTSPIMPFFDVKLRVPLTRKTQLV